MAINIKPRIRIKESRLLMAIMAFLIPLTMSEKPMMNLKHVSNTLERIIMTKPMAKKATPKINF